MAKLTPSCKYAQRTDSIYLTIELADVKVRDIYRGSACCPPYHFMLQDEVVKLTADTLTFSGTSGGKLYGLDVKLFKPVNPDESTTKVLPRSIHMFIKKVSRYEHPVKRF